MFRTSWHPSWTIITHVNYTKQTKNMSNAIGSKWSHEFIGDPHKFLHDIDQYERHYSSHGNYIATVNIQSLEPFQNPISKIETRIWRLITPMKLNQIEHANTPSCWRCLNTRSNSFDICFSKSLFEWLGPIFWAICVLILQMNIIVRKIFFLEPKLNFMWIETFLMN